MTIRPRKIQLVLDEEAQKVLLELQAASGAESMAAVLRDALGVYYSLREILNSEPDMTLALINRERSEMQELVIPTINAMLKREGSPKVVP